MQALQININFEKMIEFEDFKKVDLRVGRVTDCQKIEGSDKLLKIEVDLGSEKRQIVAGIGLSYNPEDLKDTSIVIVVNLKPREIFGHESQGMLLATSIEDDIPVLIRPEKEVDPGSKIR